MAVSNTPNAIIKGWAALSVCMRCSESFYALFVCFFALLLTLSSFFAGALGGYLFSKSFTNRRLQEYLAQNGSVTSSGRPDEKIDESAANTQGDKPLRRSVQRSL
ncbi:hypothetical protein BC940DRAFT_292894 [Gongronella butleri]|nr:hypothetical protein BC940DRAFT_292894 [Gongronella butleri]